MVTATRPAMLVSASGTGLVPHAGSRLLAEMADRTGLTHAMSEVLADRLAPQTAHDPGRVLVNLAVVIADGGETIRDIATLAHQPGLFGPARVGFDVLAGARRCDRAGSWRLGRGAGDGPGGRLAGPG